MPAAQAPAPQPRRVDAQIDRRFPFNNSQRISVTKIRFRRLFARRRLFSVSGSQFGTLSLSFSLLNAAGSLLIMFPVIFTFNVSGFLIEVFWFLISLIGLSK